MEENIFYTSIEIRAPKPIDKRMYIDEITNANLVALFGVNGEYGISNAILFNRSDKKLYYYTLDTIPSTSILNTINWAELTIAGVASFASWANDTSYTRGECVYDASTIPTGIKFYIAKDTTTIGAAPYLTSTEWLEIGSGGAGQQTVNYELDPSDDTTWSFTVGYVDINSPNIPLVQVYANFGNGETTALWELIEPELASTPVDHEIDVILTGDLAEAGLSYVSGTDNVKVVIR